MAYRQPTVRPSAAVQPLLPQPASNGGKARRRPAATRITSSRVQHHIGAGCIGKYLLQLVTIVVSDRQHRLTHRGVGPDQRHGIQTAADLVLIVVKGQQAVQARRMRGAAANTVTASRSRTT